MTLDPKRLEAATRVAASVITGKRVNELPFDRVELKEWHREGRIDDINSETKESIASAADMIITAYLEAGDDWQDVDEVETYEGLEAWGYEPGGEPQFVAVVWLVFEDGGRWMYQDEALADICPEGADVTHVQPLPPPPGETGT